MPACAPSLSGLPQGVAAAGADGKSVYLAADHNGTVMLHALQA